MLLALQFSKLKMNGREEDAIVAFAPEGLGEGQMYQALCY